MYVHARSLRVEADRGLLMRTQLWLRLTVCLRVCAVEEMPAPELPEDLVLAQADPVACGEGGMQRCYVWERGDEWSSVRVLQDTETGLAIEATDMVHDLTTLVPGLTFRLSNLSVFAEGDAAPPLDPDTGAFDLPKPHTHVTCERQVGGTPWIELFEHFVRV